MVGRGWTQSGGRPHAEAEALRRAGTAANGATAYVSLEPCAHHGETPPCAHALAAAGVSRVVAATIDPDKRVAGKGLEQMRQAGLIVDCGVLEAEAQALNTGFITRIVNNRPLVALKLATTLDGRIATRSGDSQWITGEAARRRAHLMRAEFDAVLIGSGTALTDDPLLSCRLPGLSDRSPVRIVVDGALRLPTTSKIATSARKIPTWCLTCSADDEAVDEMRKTDVEVIQTPSANGHVDLPAALEILATRGITRLLVEGGGGLAAALARGELINQVYWFRAPALIGGDGRPAVNSLNINNITDLRRFERRSIEVLGQDLLESFCIPT